MKKQKYLSHLVLAFSLTGCFGAEDQAPAPVAPTPTAAATGFSLTSPTTGLNISSCAGPYTINSVDESAHEAKLSKDVDVKLSIDSPNMQLFSDSDCLNSIQAGQIHIQKKESSTVFYSKDNIFEQVNFKLSSILGDQSFPVSLTTSETVSVSTSGNSQLTFNSAPACVGPFSVQAYDKNEFRTADTLTLSSNSALGFFSDSGCQTSITTVPSTAEIAKPYRPLIEIQVVRQYGAKFYVELPAITSPSSVSVNFSSSSNPGFTQSFILQTPAPSLINCQMFPTMPICF